MKMSAEWKINQVTGLNFTKQKLMAAIPNYDESRSAIDNMLDNGYNMIYDCGNWKFFN